MAAYTTYDQVGLAESVEDVIHDITPTDCPFYSLVKNEKVNARTFEWIEHSLANTADNFEVEGFIAQDDNLSNPVTRDNTTQILAKVFNVSGTADAVKTYGRAKETAYRLGQALKEIKRDYERAMVGVVQSKVAGDASTPRRMASVFTQILNTEQTNNGSGAGFVEQDLLDLGETCYNAGSDPTVLMIPPAVAQTVAGFAAASGRTRDFGQSREIVNAIDLIVSPYGEYRVVLNRHILADRGLLMDPTMFKTVSLRPFTRTLLAKTGDSDRHMVTGEVSVKHNVFNDSGAFEGFANAIGGGS